MVTEGRSEFLVVELPDQWVSNQMRLGNEFDLDAEEERVPCHGVCFGWIFRELPIVRQAFQGGRVLLRTWPEA